MHLSLRPVPIVTPEALEAGKRALVWDAAWASVTGAWSGGVVLVAFALSLGADPMTIGLLAAIPFLAQAVQLPTIYLVERRCATPTSAACWSCSAAGTSPAISRRRSWPST